MLIAEPDDLNIGWTVRQSFIDSLNAGNQDAVNRFKRALKVKVVTGKGYFFFPDKANAQRPQMYVDKGLFINNSQLCVAPETLILTDNGYLKISDLEGKSVNVWNGREFSEVVVKKTGENQKLVKVVTNSGFELQCTPYHKFYIMVRSNTGHRKIVEKRACELNNGDKLIKSNFPIIEGTETLNNAYDNGFFSADGCYTDQGNRVYLYHEKRDLKKYLSGIYTKWYVQEELNREYSHSESLLDKFFVPSGNFTIKSKLEWFAGLCDGDGTVARNGKVQSLQIGSVNKDFLQEVQMMLQTLGVSSKVTIVHEGGFRELPKNDGSKESKNFLCKPFYRLLIGQTGICTMQDLGFKTYRLKFTDYKPTKESTQYVKVVDVVDEGRVDDTYCFTEPKRGMGVFNGILTGQCSEIMLFNDKSHTYTCVLSSMNVSLWDEWKDTDAVYWATIFLDCVVSEFLERAKCLPGLEKAVRFTEKGRALGLGQAGLHTLFMKNMIPFESFEAHMLSNKIAKHIQNQAIEATKNMAINLGEPEWCKGYGVRNTHLIAIAPTKSTALIMGGISEGVNPDPALSFTQMTAAGEVDRLNPVLLELMKQKGVFTPKNVKQITEAQGSVQGVDWLTEDEKKVFKTAFEINQQAITRLAGTRQHFVDQGQSINYFFSADENEEYIASIFQEVFEHPHMLSAYYAYMMAGVTASKDTCEACM